MPTYCPREEDNCPTDRDNADYRHWEVQPNDLEDGQRGHHGRCYDQSCRRCCQPARLDNWPSVSLKRDGNADADQATSSPIKVEGGCYKQNCSTEHPDEVHDAASAAGFVCTANLEVKATNQIKGKHPQKCYRAPKRSFCEWFIAIVLHKRVSEKSNRIEDRCYSEERPPDEED